MARRAKNAVEDHATTGESIWVFLARLLELQDIRTFYLFGPPGTGKTYGAYHIGRPNGDVYAVTLTPDTSAAELRGTWIPHGNEFRWHDGPFTAAMREGARLIINEVSHASDDVQALLYPVLESEMTARLTLPTRETVRPAKNFQVVCTDNASPAMLPPALRDRFDCVVEVDEPHPDALARLSESLRRAALQSLKLEAERALGMRVWLTIERFRDLLGLADACRAVLGRERGAQVYDALSLAQDALAI